MTVPTTPTTSPVEPTVATGGRGLRRDALLSGGASVTTTALSAIASIVIARQLGVSGRGASAAILSIAVLCGTFATVGLPAAASYAIARTSPDARPAITAAAVAAALMLGTVAAAACVAIVLISRPAGAGTVAVVAGGAVALSLVLQHVVQQLVLTGSSLPWYAAVQVGPAVCVLSAVAVISAVGHLTIGVVVALSCGGSCVGVAAGLIVLRRGRVLGWRLEWLRVGHLRGTLRPYLGFAAMLFIVTSLAQIVQRLDIVLVEWFRGSHQAGLYAVAAQMGDGLLVVPAALGAVVFRRGALSEPGHWRDGLRALSWATAVSAAGALLLALVAPHLIRWVFGASYSGSATAFRCLLPGIVLLGAQSLISNYIASQGRLRAVLGAWLTAAALGLGADLFVIPEAGIVGAAIVSSVSYLVVLGMHVRALIALRPT